MVKLSITLVFTLVAVLMIWGLIKFVAYTDEQNERIEIAYKIAALEREILSLMHEVRLSYVSMPDKSSEALTAIVPTWNIINTKRELKEVELEELRELLK